MNPPLRVLLVLEQPVPILRPVTRRTLHRAIADEPGIELTTWALRPVPDAEPSDLRVVDSLRLWPPARALDLVGLARPAAGLRGIVLRRWWRAAAPDVVVLDGGRGERIIPKGSTALLVHRIGDEPDAVRSLEPFPTRRPALVIQPPGAAPPDVPSLTLPELHDGREAMRWLDPGLRAEQREKLGIPPGVPLVTGWGSDGWLDGPDIFVRALWALESRHGIRAHGLWLGIDPEGEDGAVLAAEADRCGLGGRLHLHAVPDESLSHCGDVALLPYRGAGERLGILSVVMSGCHVVGFTALGVVDEAVHLVDHLDIDAAADRLAFALGLDREHESHTARTRLDAACWVAFFLEHVSALRSP